MAAHIGMTRVDWIKLGMALLDTTMTLAHLEQLGDLTEAQKATQREARRTLQLCANAMQPKTPPPFPDPSQN